MSILKDILAEFNVKHAEISQNLKTQMTGFYHIF